MNTTVCDNGTVQFFYFLFMRWDIIIITNCGLLIVILEPCIKAWKWTDEILPKRRLR